MTPREFQSIKEKVETAKEKKIRAEGALAKIEEQWKKEYEIKSIEDAEEKVKELDTEIENDKAKLEKMYVQLDKMAKWEEM